MDSLYCWVGFEQCEAVKGGEVVKTALIPTPTPPSVKRENFTLFGEGGASFPRLNVMTFTPIIIARALLPYYRRTDRFYRSPFNPKRGGGGGDVGS